MKKKRIILSYDYELFFGDRSGTVLKSIIEPTNKLMDVMEQNGFRGNFFVDYLMFRELEKLSDERAAADLNLLKEQIRDMVRRGHRVELHLHPHWIDAKYNGDGTWNFDDFTHYSLSSLDEETIVAMFKEGTDYLNKLAAEVEPGYKIVAFRAGGWAVQPFDKLERAFIESGISIDSSASLGIFNYLRDSYYDFREMPNKVYYRFSNDVCIESGDGPFIEVPITSFKISFYFSLEQKLLRKFTNKQFLKYTDGTHNRNESVVKNRLSIMKKIKQKLFSSQKGMMNFSYIGGFSLYFLIRGSKDGLICFIDHPKDICDATLSGISKISKYCKSINYIDLI